ncbi:MAG: type II secretion system F family protein [Candidatus Komeilibacteria bacterium]|nr:type II secretion system F family protein [Candidatus Komeilibacteria bacterium]
MSLLADLKNFSTISLKDKLFFVQNLKVMMKTGIALTTTLQTLADQTANQRFAGIIKEVKNAVEAGQPFSQSLAKYPAVFDSIFVKMVEAGEASGKLDEVLEQIFLQLKKSHELRGKVIAALIYPLVVAVAMLGIGLAMMILVVPKITSIFAEQNVALPFITQLVIGLSQFLVHYWYFGLILIIILAVGLISLRRLEGTKKILHQIILHLPIFGSISKKINLAQFTRTFSSLLRTNIAVEKSLAITADTLKNYWYQKALRESASSLVKGSSLTQILKKYPKLFPPLLIQMTAAGEESGSVDDLFVELAQFYEEEINDTMRTLPSLLEPILILLIGAAVATMAVAILLPMYSITQHI